MRLGIRLDANELATHGQTTSVMQVHKGVGNLLDHILYEMEDQDLVVPDELKELKQWLRYKGNSDREQGNYELWEHIPIKELQVKK